MHMRFALMAATALAAASPLATCALECGMCAHVGRGGYWRRHRTFAKAKEAGCAWIRTDFDWWQMERRPGVWTFEKYDALLRDAEAAGINILPILYSPPEWRRPVASHIREWQDFVARVMARWGDRLPYVEIWNEPLYPGRGMGATNFAAVMRAAYAAVKRVSPRTKVLLGECSAGQLESLYAHGAGGAFDVMNMHLYSPLQTDIPEGCFAPAIERVRSCLAAHGDGAKPIWVTETGWPTPPARHVADILKAGLALAEPSRRAWRVVHTDSFANDASMDNGTEDLLALAFPSGSAYEPCHSTNLAARLARGDVDVLVLPFEEKCPPEVVAPAYEFVRQGGTLIDFGGLPLYAKLPDRAEWLRRFHIAPKAWWMDGRYPKRCTVSPVVPSIAAAHRFKGERFLSGDYCGEGDEFLPLVSGLSTNGQRCVAAAVYRFGGDLKGRAIISTIFDHQHRTTSEARQGRLVARTMAILAACGVEKAFWYEQRSNEHGPNSRYEGACHFGLLRGDYSEKDGFAAFRTFVRMCPPGSSIHAEPWDDSAEGFHRVRWKRPNGMSCGILWKTGNMVERIIPFRGNAKFFDHLGRALEMSHSEGSSSVEVSGAPLYWVIPDPGVR